MDLVGGVSPQLSTAGQLQLMQWVCGYQQTLRGLGVQEVRGTRHAGRASCLTQLPSVAWPASRGRLHACTAWPSSARRPASRRIACTHACMRMACAPQELVRLPVAPLSSNPDGTPGFGLLLDSYTDRMEATMTAWYKAILQQARCRDGRALLLLYRFLCCSKVLVSASAHAGTAHAASPPARTLAPTPCAAAALAATPRPAGPGWPAAADERRHAAQHRLGRLFPHAQRAGGAAAAAHACMLCSVLCCMIG